MVYTNISGTTIKGPYQEIKKDKEKHVSPRQQQQQQQQQQYRQQQSSRKDDKYGSWGPIFKNKENFVDMHTC
ncbi:probable serine/threonine-protein kinase dyrk1 [Temnothorax curvispinosus]|uniref:Probable serine/threonine-protein kinase dyrk1 n=1 Tax=Temnothorax curvispinosus TaxID=300111 RepID=A0A6J1RDC1_9HYME|nr:probable serine/threonine-protein kinase dyrk1 [Temnothorax curvispinosus]